MEEQNWLINHACGRFVAVKDINEEVAGIPIGPKKKNYKKLLEASQCCVKAIPRETAMKTPLQ